MTDVPIKIPAGELPSEDQIRVVMMDALARGDGRALAVLKAHMDAIQRLTAPQPDRTPAPSREELDALLKGYLYSPERYRDGGRPLTLALDALYSRLAQLEYQQAAPNGGAEDTA